MPNLKIFIILFAVALFASCSKDPIEDYEEAALVVDPCLIEKPDAGCTVAYLEGENSKWIKIPDPGELEDPYFLYAQGNTDDPLGTATISLTKGQPVVRLNDTALDDFLIQVSQYSNGSEKACEAEENISGPISDKDPDAAVQFSENFTYPFYVRIKANVCP